MVEYTDQNLLPEYITIGEYLFHRLKQLEVLTIFGLPGEFNMTLIDKIYKVSGLHWAGNANELNAAYSADGYSRMKGLGCLITTFGVGELSAINGIAGSFSEHVGILHVVGMPAISVQRSQLLLHHTLGDGDYDVFHRLASDVSCYTTVIAHPDVCIVEIDKCITTAWMNQQPVYMGLPINLINVKILSKELDNPLNLTVPQNDQEVEAELISQLVKKIYSAQNPAIVADACVSRFNIEHETKELCDKTAFPYFVTPMGKGTIDENDEHFGGVFTGSISSPHVREIVDFADLIIVVGNMLSDFNTTSFHFAYKAKDIVLLTPTYVKLKNKIYPDLNIKPLLRSLLLRLEKDKIKYRFKKKQNIIIPKSKLAGRILLRQEWVWNEISHWFQEGDIIITETGTSAFGINQTKFPKNAQGISQTLWGSAGYTLGACLGASFAADEISKKNAGTGKPNRVILFVGDGAFQLTMQELSTMVKWNLTPYIFLMNNQGYSIDRFLHHISNAPYYDIQLWDYLNLLRVFGATNYETRKIVTVGDFQEMVNDPGFSINNKIRMIEIMLPPMDVPQSLMEKWIEEQESKKRQLENSDSDASKRRTIDTISSASVSSSESNSAYSSPYKF